MIYNRNSRILLPIFALSIIGGVVVYLMQSDQVYHFKFIMIVALIGLTTFIPVARHFKKRQDIKAHIPVEDEMSRLLEVHAGSYAFRFSMVLWFLIFILKNYFPDVDDVLGIGILVSSIIYGLSLLYLKRFGLPSANQN